MTHSDLMIALTAKHDQLRAVLAEYVAKLDEPGVLADVLEPQLLRALDDATLKIVCGFALSGLHVAMSDVQDAADPGASQ